MKHANLIAATFIFAFFHVGFAYEPPVSQMLPVDNPVQNPQLSLMDVGCSFHSPADITAMQKKKKTKKAKKEYKGEATYYSDKYQGRKTASGEVYDKDKFTAAVRRDALPLEFGTMVEVTVVSTGKKVKVKVNDRMSDNARAFIDLSRAAAEEVGLIDAGRMEVRVRVVK